MRNWRSQTMRSILLTDIRFRSRFPDDGRLHKIAAVGTGMLFRMLIGTRDPVQVQVEGITMLVPRQHVGHYLIGYEPFTTALWLRSLRPGHKALDIGANIGYFSLLAARSVGQLGMVFAFEPAPSNFRLLQENVRLNELSNVIPMQEGVSDKSGRQTLFIATSPDIHSFRPHPLAIIKSKLTVDCIAIDDFLGGDKIDVVKMDIEGAEVQALEGMCETIQTSRDLTLFIELNPKCLKQFGYEATDLIASLCDLGFRVGLIDEIREEIVPLTSSLLAAVYEDSLWRGNLYCVKREAEHTLANPTGA